MGRGQGAIKDPTILRTISHNIELPKVLQLRSPLCRICSIIEINESGLHNLTPTKGVHKQTLKSYLIS